MFYILLISYATVSKAWVMEIIRNKMAEQSWTFNFWCQSIMGYENHLTLNVVIVGGACNEKFITCPNPYHSL